MKKTILAIAAAVAVVAANAQITTQPEGTLLENMEWQSQGYTPDYSAQKLNAFTEKGAIAHVVKDGNKFFIKDPISHYKRGIWIEGALEADATTVTFHTPQLFVNENGTQFYITRLENVGGKLAKTANLDITFTYSNGRLTQTDGGFVVITNLQGGSAGYIDYNINIGPMPETATMPPLTATAESYQLSYEHEGAPMSKTTSVVFSGDDVFIANPTGATGSWIHGKLEGDKIVCQNKQFVGPDETMGYYAYLTIAESTVEMVEIPGLGQWPVATTTLTDDETLVFTYDAATRSFSTDKLFLINSSNTELGTMYEEFGKAAYTTYTEVPATPADPVFVSNSGLIEGYAMGVFAFNMPATDTEGNYINQENMYYNIYVDDKLLATTTGLTDIPYNYSDGQFFRVSGTSHTFTYLQGNEPKEKLGCQVFYKVGDVVNASKLVWAQLTPEGISTLEGGKTVAGTEFFDAAGRRVEPTAKGLIIKKVTFTDGTSQTVKHAAR